MEDNTLLMSIREKEKESHTQIYETYPLFASGSWLHKPVASIMTLCDHFQDYEDLQILDLGCGIGRNCIPIAKRFSHVNCQIDCVDILELAIEKLKQNAEIHSVAQKIDAIVCSIDDYAIAANRYDWILAVSALEHVDSEATFWNKLYSIRSGIRENGLVSLVINSHIQETNTADGSMLPPQFEVNLPTDLLLQNLYRIFSDWLILKCAVQRQNYTVPRGNKTSRLESNVVTFVAKK